MAGFSKITITFNEDLERTKRVRFNYAPGSMMSEIWVLLRFGPNMVTIGEPTGNAGQRSAINYAESLMIDYGFLGFDISVIGNVVTIIANSVFYKFEWITGDSSVDYVIDNTTEDVLEITNTWFTPLLLGNKCTKITVNVETNIVADQILAPVIIDPNTQNPFSFIYSRGGTIYVKIKTFKGQVVEKFIQAPDLLTSDIVDVGVVNTMTGAIATVNVSQNGLMDLQYSLDNVTFRNSNVFTGLGPGDFTVYVKDQFGCSTRKNFKVVEQGQIIIKSPVFYVPTSNSIRFAQRVVWGDCGNYKNDYNTLSCEANVEYPKKEIQQFQSCDTLTIQFKSNYKENLGNISIVGSPLVLVIPAIKKTDFIGRSDRRDAVLTNLGDGSERTGIFFIAGNTYDVDTNDVNGDYALYGTLPEWGRAGNSVQLPNGNWHVIEDVIYLEDKEANVLVIDTGTALLEDEEIIVSSFYNLHDFDVFEFEIDFSQYIGDNVEVWIKANDPDFDSVIYKSEEIAVAVRWNDTVEIEYWDDENTDVFYSTGIRNKMRVQIEKMYGQPAGSIESYDTDTDTILISADIRQREVFNFSPVTKAIMWKLDEALSHRYVSIDGVRYGDKNIDVSESLEGTNLYDVTATMKKAVGYSGKGIQFGNDGGEIPALIETGTGYVKYQ